MLTHPSKTLIGDEVLCEGCEDLNKSGLDDVEILEMRNEARLRLLKAEKVKTKKHAYTYKLNLYYRQN